MENKTITVVVPVYNMEPYLKRAVDSLLQQTYRDFEIVLVDDGSTDGGGAICDAYAAEHDHIRVIHQANGGLSSARNVGIEAATGAYIIFPDPDDWVDADYLLRLMALHDLHGADLEICGHYTVDADKQSVHNPNGKTTPILRDAALVMLLSSDAFCGFAWNKLYHLDLIRSHNLRFDTELGMAQDLHFAFRYLLHCDTIAYDPTPVYYYYQHSGGVTNTKSPLTPRKVSGLRTYEKIAELAHDSYPEAEQAAYATLANMSLQFMYIYYDSGMRDPALLEQLRGNLRRHWTAFRDSGRFGFARKTLGRIARRSPYLYYRLKSLKGH